MECVFALKDIYKPKGYSIMQNGGVFIDVGHYHLHIFPRYKGDRFVGVIIELIKAATFIEVESNSFSFNAPI